MNLYVGNLPWGISEEELESHFAQHGSVKAVRIITEGHSGRSKVLDLLKWIQKKPVRLQLKTLTAKILAEET